MASEKQREHVPSEQVSEDPWTPPDIGGAETAPQMRAQAAAPIVNAPGPGVLPFYTFQDFQVSDRAVIRVNVANGNMFFAATDVSLSGPGQALQLDRYYNSLTGSQTTEGAFALGWGSSLAPFDVGLYLSTAGSAVVYLPGGASATFVKSGTAWSGPAGLNATLSEDPASTVGRYVLTYNRTGERLSFDTSGTLRGHTDRNGVGMRIDAGSRILEAATHTASGRNVQFTYGFGSLIERATDSSGRTLDYGHTENGYLASSPDGMAYGYQGYGLLNSLSLGGVTHQIAYDNSKRATSVTVKKSGEPDRVTRFAYNSGATVVTDPEGRTATYTYDSMGRVTTTSDGLNRSRSQQWTANSDIGQSTDAIGTGTTTYTYDTSGNRTGTKLPTGAASSALFATGVNCSAPNTGTAFQPKCSTDDAGNKKQYQYDAAGNLTKQSDTSTSTPVTEFEKTYGGCGAAAGQVCTTKDGNGNVTSYSYNARGDLTKVTPPSPQGTTSYTYDSAGRVQTVTDGNGDVTKYQYDKFDRVLTTTYDDGSTVRSSYNASGTERSKTDSAGGSTTYEYNAQNRVTKQTGPSSGLTQTYSYDKAGNVLTFTDAAGTTTYSYDAANQLTRLQEPGGACPTSGKPAANSGCVTFAYDQNGRETVRTTPGAATTTTTRDLSGRPTRITAKTGSGATAVDIGYTYTAPGGSSDRANVQARTSYAEQGLAAGTVTSYTYDSRNRLTRAAEQAGTSLGASWSYRYDRNGNRTQQVRNIAGSPETISYTYDAANRLTSASGQNAAWRTAAAAPAATFTYDAAGNQTYNGLMNITVTYGVRGEATSTNGTKLDYFGPGNTDRISTGSRTFTSGALGLNSSANGSSTQSYTRTSEGASVGFKAQNRWYYVQDHLGSVVGIMSATGSYSGGYSYTPYGEARFTGNTAAVTTNPLRYISGYHDGNGVYKLGARYYDTSLGRFTQMDPSGQEKNAYSYAASNPCNFSDPTGYLYEDGWNWGQSTLVAAATGVASAGVGCLSGAVAGATAAGAGAAPGCAIGAMTGFISGVVTGFVGDAVTQAF